MNKKLISVLGKTTFLFGLLVWLYVITMQIVRSESVAWTFTHWFRMRMSYVGIICFVASVIGFVVWQYLNFKSE